MFLFLLPFCAFNLDEFVELPDSHRPFRLERFPLGFRDKLRVPCRCGRICDSGLCNFWGRAEEDRISAFQSFFPCFRGFYLPFVVFP